jgi:hypothetical protein
MPVAATESLTRRDCSICLQAMTPGQLLASHRTCCHLLHAPCYLEYQKRTETTPPSSLRCPSCRTAYDPSTVVFDWHARLIPDCNPACCRIYCGQRCDATPCILSERVAAKAAKHCRRPIALLWTSGYVLLTLCMHGALIIMLDVLFMKTVFCGHRTAANATNTTAVARDCDEDGPDLIVADGGYALCGLTALYVMSGYWRVLSDES